MARLELRIAKLERKHDEDAGEYSLAFDWPHDEKGITRFQREVEAALETGRQGLRYRREEADSRRR